MSHGFYNLCISFQETSYEQEIASEFNVFRNLEFFIITRFILKKICDLSIFF